MKETNFLHKMYQNICKDTGDQNESSKLIVVVRLLILTMIAYSLLSSGICLTHGRTGFLPDIGSIISGYFCIVLSQPYLCFILRTECIHLNLDYV